MVRGPLRRSAQELADGAGGAGGGAGAAEGGDDLVQLAADGLAYYETTRDTGSHFFIDYLPKGTYVFEYATRVQLRGAYQTGVASIQCMYAPEFNSHSESLPLTVR